MIIKGLSLERLASFADVAVAGGIARVAPGDPVRQSLLSRQIGELEGALGTTLFTRANRRLALTDEGARLLRVVRDLSVGLQDLRADRGPPSVSIGAGDSVLQWLVLPCLPQLHARPRLVAMGAAQVVRGLEEREIDLGILRASEATGDLTRRVLGRVRYAVFGRKDAPLAVLRGEPGLDHALASLGEIALEVETFPQVAQAIRDGYRGVLPTYARHALAGIRHHTHAALDAVATSLIVAWRPKLDEQRPELARVRDELLLQLSRSSVLARA